MQPSPAERALLAAGVLVPVLYYTALLVTPLFWPGYSHVRQYASELGSPDSPRAELFNFTIMAAGGAAMLASVGFFMALKRIGGRVLPSLLAGVALFLWGVSFLMGGLFPMPDPRHGGFGLALAMHLVPLLILWALRGKTSPRLKWFLVAVFVASTSLILVMFGLGGLVRRANVGLWQRGYSLSVIPWLAVVAARLMRR